MISYNDVMDKVVEAKEAAAEAGYTDVETGLRMAEYCMKTDQLEALAEAAAELELTVGDEEGMDIILADMLDDQIELAKEVYLLAEDLKDEIMKEDDELSDEDMESIEEAECDTPGEKIRSKGEGRGMAHGKGKGPMGGKGKGPPSREDDDDGGMVKADAEKPGGTGVEAATKKPGRTGWKKIFRKKGGTKTKKYLCHTGIKEEQVGRKRRKAWTTIVKYKSGGTIRAIKRVLGYKTPKAKKPRSVEMNGRKLPKCSGKLD